MVPIKRCLFFLLLACFSIEAVRAQHTNKYRTDSLKADSLKAAALRADSLKTDALKKKPAIKLQTVTIRGQRPLIEQRIDGIVFNTGALSSVAGSDASDVLRKVPMLSVDGNGGLSVRGNPNVKVLIDGKPSEIYASSLADALRAIRGENIVKVAVITSPSSRYDAQGTDAVVNIMTRKIKNDATSGSLGISAGNRSENLMGDVHRKQGDFLFNAEALYQKYWNRNGSVLQRKADQQQLFQENETRQSGDYFNGGLNLLYSPDSLNTISLGYRARWSPNTTTLISDNYSAAGQDRELLFQRNMETPARNKGYNYTAGFEGKSKDQQTAYAILGMYATFVGRNDYTLSQQSPDSSPYRENFFGSNLYQDYLAQGDYTRSFTNSWKLEAGAKITARNARNDSRFEVYDPATGNYQHDPARSAGFTYQNRIYAGYVNTSLQLGKWGLSGGLRYEQTVLKAVFKSQEVTIPSFDNLVPQLLFSRTLDDKTILKISYAVRLQRPDLSSLDPTVNTSDSLTLQYGNPKLDPELTRRYEFSYSVNDPKLFRDFSLFFNDNRNSIENIRLPLSNGRFESTWKNVGKKQQLGLSAALNWKPAAALTLSGTLTGQYSWLESNALGISNKGLMQQLTVNAGYKFPKGYSLDFYGFFGSKNLRLQGYRTGWKFYNMTISKKSRNERLNLSLRVETFLTPHTYIDEVIASPEYAQRLSYRYQNQHIRLSLSYKIGKEIKSPQAQEH